MLGATTRNLPDDIEQAYDYQVACDAVRTKVYLSALETVAEKAQVIGQENLMFKVARERSMKRYTIGEYYSLRYYV